jgi:hypothetical protein
MIRVLIVANCLLFTSVSPGQDPVDFAHDVVPVLRQHCVPCHGGREAKGSFSLNTRELLAESGHVVVGKPDESHLLALVESKVEDEQMPPADKPRVPEAERLILKRWIAEGLKWEDGYSFAPQAYEPPLKPRRPELPDAIGSRTNPIDRILDAHLAAQKQTIPVRIDDASFLRRATLDLIGLLPEPETLDSFLANSHPDKREKEIRRLLDDRIAYADHWLSFFNDLLRNDYSGTGFITGGRQQVSTWLYEALVNNKPFDQFARELIAPSTPASQGYIDGIRWRGEVSAGQTVEIQFAQSVAQSFLGINMKCASCHDSFIDRWKLDEAYGLAAIYSSRPLEIHRCDKPIGKPAAAAWLFPELGQIDPAAPREERLKQLSALMTDPQNGRFARTIVNRLWYKLMGRGIVHPLDAMQTPPWNEDLLDVLANHLVDNQYDLKSVLFLIATSEAYQSKIAERTGKPDVTADGSYLYRGPLARRMTAEQFLDAVWQVTESGPTTMDAPVFRGLADAEALKSLKLAGRWIWGDSAKSGAPPAGETISLRTQFTLDDEVVSGGAVITCDNSFVLYVNGREIQRGNDWTQPVGVALKGLLKKGDNTVVVVATNAGDQPNPAGLYFEARMKLANDQEKSIASGPDWEWTVNQPAAKEGRMGKLDGPWQPVTEVKAVASWSGVIDSKGRQLLVQAMTGDLRMVRASLMKNDFLMRSLGRPFREQIVSMRPDELTTLEAIDLSNGATLATFLSQGATKLQETWGQDREGLIDHLFRYALSRKPSATEMTAIRDSLSDPLTPEAVEDLLWALFMQPEFLVVR